MDEKILKIAHERYRGWRSTFHSTYKAYNTDAARLANVPEDLQLEEWEWLMDYFGNDSKFQVFTNLTVCTMYLDDMPCSDCLYFCFNEWIGKQPKELR